MGRLAVQTGIFPLYEVEDGQCRLNVKPSKLRPVQDYLKLQGRFRHLSEEIIKEIQDRVDKDYAGLLEKAGIKTGAN